jgi:hypothetical protein
MSHMPFRRSNLRVPVEALCTELVGGHERPGLLVDLSPRGVRLQRPFAAGVRGQVVQLEFELPEADEIVWAKGEVCFDQLWRVPRPGSVSAIVRTSGIRLVAAAERHLRMLRDYVFARHCRGT